MRSGLDLQGQLRGSREESNHPPYIPTPIPAVGILGNFKPSPGCNLFSSIRLLYTPPTLSSFPPLTREGRTGSLTRTENGFELRSRERAHAIACPASQRSIGPSQKNEGRNGLSHGSSRSRGKMERWCSRFQEGAHAPERIGSRPLSRENEFTTEGVGFLLW